MAGLSARPLRGTASECSPRYLSECLLYRRASSDHGMGRRFFGGISACFQNNRRDHKHSHGVRDRPYEDKAGQGAAVVIAFRALAVCHGSAVVCRSERKRDGAGHLGNDLLN